MFQVFSVMGWVSGTLCLDTLFQATYGPKKLFVILQEIYKKNALCILNKLLKNEASNTFVYSIPLHNSKHSWPSVR